MKISVIIPAFNVEQYIQECVKSVLSQKYVEEIIVVEDGSSDRTLNRIHELLKTDPRIKLFQHPDKLNHGRSKSRNLGLIQASYNWIGFLDADDYYLEKRFDHLPRKADKGIDGIYDGIISIYMSKKLKRQHDERLTFVKEKVQPGELLNFLIKNSEQRFSLNGLVIKKEVIASGVMFDESMVSAEDTDFIWRLASENTLISGGLSRPVAVRRVHGNNSYSDKKNLMKARYQFYKKWNKSGLQGRLDKGAKKILQKKLLYYWWEIKEKKQNYFIQKAAKTVKLVALQMGIKLL